MYDIMILGGGPAGYVAAEVAGAKGMRVLLVEQDRLGGVCLNAGCIPTKAFLHSAKLYSHAKEMKPFGVGAENVTFDYPAVKARTEKVQETLRQGIGGLMKKAKADVVPATGRITGKVAGGFKLEAGDKTYEGKNLLVCSGSRVATPPIPGLRDNPVVLTSDTIMQQPALPEHLVVIGGGVIGVEFACFHALAGRKVTVVEMLAQIGGPTLDAEASKTIQRRLEEMGVAFHLGAKVERVDGGTVHFADKTGAPQSVSADRILAATGRAPRVEGLGLETLGIDFDRTGLRVDERARTNVPGVHAAGDCTGRIQLAHYASRQAMVAVNNIAGRADRMRENAIPSVIYTDPEVAQVGLTEAQAKAKGLETSVRKVPMGASGRYLAENEGGRAFVKAVLGAKDGAILGMTVAGPYASEMIGAACTMIEAELRACDAAEIVFPHPTVAELMRDIML